MPDLSFTFLYRFSATVLLILSVTFCAIKDYLQYYETGGLTPSAAEFNFVECRLIQLELHLIFVSRLTKYIFLFLLDYIEMFVEIKNWHSLELNNKSFIGYDFNTGKTLYLRLTNSLGNGRTQKIRSHRTKWRFSWIYTIFSTGTSLCSLLG